MLFRRKKHVLMVCPKTGKTLKSHRKHHWVMWLFPVTSFFAFIWFLIRVIPKPSRAAYPCQRVAFPLASGFLVWIAGLIASNLAYHKAKRLFHQSRYVVGGICVSVAVMAIWWSLSITASDTAKASFTPSDPPNSPMGVAKGINPGRVVWIHDANATSWDGSTGSWWDANNTNQNTVDRMMSKSIRDLTSEPNDTDAWDALFRHFNRTGPKGDVGYQVGEKIIIKINENNQNNNVVTAPLAIDASPQMVRDLLRQLVYKAGVPQTAIMVCDAMRPISKPVYNCCHPEFPDVDYRGGFGYDKYAHPPNKLDPNFTWVSNAITYSNGGYTNPDGRYVPQCVLDADYMINMAILKAHRGAASVTLCFKNLFGTIGTPSGLHDQYYWQYNWGMNAYDLLVDIMGHKNIGAKTVLFIIDGLYGSSNGACDTPTKWTSTPFNNDWPSSIFVSQDPVAIDSVGLDFIRTELAGRYLYSNADNYLHEAAKANNPPSGTVYKPIPDGNQLTSLGVHEHWNNATAKQYSRNLGTGNGIELVPTSIDRLVGDFEPDYDVDFADFAVLASAWQSETGDGNWNRACDISDPNDDVIDYNDLAVFTVNWLAGVE